MQTAKDIMTTDVVFFTPDMDIAEAARTLLEKKINGAPVVEESQLVGIVCQSDLISQQKSLKLPSVFTFLDGFVPLGSISKIEHEIQKISALTVRQAMTENPVTVSPDTSLEEIATIMVDKKLHTLPVVEKGKLVGILGKCDVLKTVTQREK